MNSSDPIIGRLIDGRYQVRSRIARGGMATVYLATDLRLERRVAIKVMHGHLADDSQYKARFIQEARSAARLAHPNVVNVYDQGQDAETAYLVMEYLPGITLRDLLQEHQMLTTTQAIDILEAVLSGLAAAHQNGIVHRDLKPENVLLADDGRIKIGDFGLARAATANTATGNALLGTIAYLSPELVTRGIADTRSDIYAVGIMLFEMLAGEQPFKGEQPFQIAHQHANDTVGVPSSKNPRVPPQLDELVLWATARNPDQRPRDAKTMLDYLLQIAAEMSDPLHDAPDAGSMTRTMVIPKAPSSQSNETGATRVLRPATLPEARKKAPVANATALLERKVRRRGKRGPVWAVVLLLLAALTGGTGWYFGSGPGALVGVPDVSGKTRAAAVALLSGANLTVSGEPVAVFNATIASGSVVGTRPEAGKNLAPRSSVTLLTSKGPQPLPLPALVGMEEGAARTAIASAGFVWKQSKSEFSGATARGTVLRVLDSQGVDISKQPTYFDQQAVSFVVSEGPVPRVEGKKFAEATTMLASVGLTSAEGQHNYSDTVAKGSVLAISPPTTTTISPGDTLTLTISDGPAPVPVPNVVNMMWTQAKSVLQNAGFVLDYDIRADDPFASLIAKVTSTKPAAGTQVDRGTTIKIRFTS